jgi:hypothetical protein
MSRMTTWIGCVAGGVDTHGQSHHAAVIDELGRQLGDREFPATPGGYRALLRWMLAHGELARLGIEGRGPMAPDCCGTCGQPVSQWSKSKTLKRNEFGGIADRLDSLSLETPWIRARSWLPFLARPSPISDAVPGRAEPVFLSCGRRGVESIMMVLVVPPATCCGLRLCG